MVLLDWPQPHHLWIGRNRGKSCPLSDRPAPAQPASRISAVEFLELGIVNIVAKRIANREAHWRSFIAT
jgi:hypothetical protein